MSYTGPFSRPVWLCPTPDCNGQRNPLQAIYWRGGDTTGKSPVCWFCGATRVYVATGEVLEIAEEVQA